MERNEKLFRILSLVTVAVFLSLSHKAKATQLAQTDFADISTLAQEIMVADEINRINSGDSAQTWRVEDTKTQAPSRVTIENNYENKNIPAR